MAENLHNDHLNIIDGIYVYDSGKYKVSEFSKLNFNCFDVNNSNDELDDRDPLNCIRSTMNLSIPNSKYLLEEEPMRTADSNSLEILNWNVRSIPTNFKVFDQMYDISADIICLCETRLDKDIVDYRYFRNNYFAFHEPRDRNGGGVSLFIKEDLKPELVQEQSYICPAFEIVSATFKVNNCVNFISSIYRPPDTDTELFLTKLEELLEFIRLKNYKNYYLAGDWNVNLLKHTDSLPKKLLDLTANYFGFPIITKPTRVKKQSATLIDNLWTDNIANILKSSILIDDITDHFPCLSLFNTKRIKNDYSSPQSKKEITRRIILLTF